MWELMSHLDLLQYHAFCLTNTGTRLTQYERAIAAVVRQGDVVVDLGTGSGLLAVLACRAGARRVYAIEASDAVQIGTLITSTTEFAERIEFVHATSQKVALSEQVDVIVGDIHDTFGFQPGGLASIMDVRDRLLKPGGTLIPQATELMIAPLEAAALYAREIDVWNGCVHGVGLSSIRPFAVSHVHPGRFDSDQLLSPAAAIGTLDLARATSLHFSGSAVTTIHRDGIAHGLCGCFVTTLAGDIRMGNVPGDSSTTNFAQAFFPFDQPVPVAAGDEVSISIDSHDGHIARWRAAISRGGQRHAQFDHSTLNGLLVSPASAASRLRRGKPSQLRTLGPSRPGTVEPSHRLTIAPSHRLTIAPSNPRPLEPLPSVLPSSAMPDVSGRLRVHRSVLSRELAGETVLLNLESGVYYGLDAVGTRAWNLLAEERTLADVCTIMLEEFEVTHDTLQQDLTTLVRELCEKQLLVPVSSSTS
jgi:protein arginine N-methyltransferase 1